MRSVTNLLSYINAITFHPLMDYSATERKTEEMNAVNYFQVTDCTHDAAQYTEKL